MVCRKPQQLILMCYYLTSIPAAALPKSLVRFHIEIENWTRLHGLYIYDRDLNPESMREAAKKSYLVARTLDSDLYHIQFKKSFPIFRVTI